LIGEKATGPEASQIVHATIGLMLLRTRRVATSDAIPSKNKPPRRINRDSQSHRPRGG
jgi:hypothetical protein